MTNRNQQKGTAFESAIVKAFIAGGYPHAIRRGKQGVKDKGDLYLPGEGRYVAEAKHVSRFNLAMWYAEAQQEAKNAGVPVGVVIHKRRGKADGMDQWVTMTVRDFLFLMTGREV